MQVPKRSSPLREFTLIAFNTHGCGILPLLSTALWMPQPTFANLSSNALSPRRPVALVVLCLAAEAGPIATKVRPHPCPDA